ncbi:YSIRK signal domain/LPXTG anchor domain surface protein [Streptococcus mitis]|uniref:YSIRK signal domain/LPXTG anchor domain surface protein n=2 Tax=Streptococcus TaxID=1301 RepID=A0A2N6P5U0_STROR|nr:MULTISPECIES: G5 domain-containing protein [Streptococcus]PKZ98731.1 YSIRK signal domain/LPXTG anchor domain surface protein [Streptococcus mitis]PMB86036.1 YSIRK signal domain/LPXTG anchor domain surface protein [Streptococcus oralis subsp. dentisani]
MKDIFNKRQRFSIRKFSVGVASVLIGIALFTPSQGVLASTENSPSSVEKREAVQPIPDNQNNPASELDTRDVPIRSTRTTELGTSGDKENNSLITRASVAGEDRSSTPEVRAASNPSEVKKYELTDEYAKQIKAGVIGSEGNKLDSLLLNGPKLSPEAYTDEDYLKDKEELYIYEKDGKKYVGYNSHPLLEDTDGDGIIDSKEKPDEKLKWNVSERDMIMFMELSYRDDNYIDRVLDHKKPLTESELYKKNGDSRPRYEYMMMNKELGPYWERKKSYHTSSGLDAVLYETKSDFLYLPNGTAQVLAFRGTSDAKDIVADGVLGVGSNPQQGNDAENIMRELAKDKSITNLYLTGHSLGGYLVQRAMVEAYQLAYSDSRVMSPKEQRAYRNFYNNVLKKGTTFNAPKVVTSWVSRREFWQKGLDSKKIAKSGKMTHYIVDNDSTIRKGVSNDSDVVINVGRTSGGHSSRSYFEADLINRRSEFMSGKRISLDGTGYQDKKITTVKSVEKFGETTVYSKSGDDIIKSTTVSMKDPDTGQITKNTLDEVFKKDGAKAKVVVTPLDPSVRYEKDATRAKEEAKVTVSGTPGTNTVTTTYTVNPTDGSLIPHEGQPVTIPSTPTVVKVPAKDEIEYLKEGDDVIKKTTSYQVDASTGDLTPTETTEIFKRNGAKSTVVVTPLEPSVRYEKDATRAKGEANVTTAGTPGTSTVTTTYTVNPTDGSLVSHEGQPVIKPSTPTVVKVPAKDEVEYLKEGDDVVKKTITYAVNASTGNLTPTETTEIFKRNGAKSKVIVTSIEPSVRYEKDATKAKGEANVTTAGTPGTSTVTTTYTVKPTDGRLIPHEGQPVTIPSTPTVVKVPAKDEVEYLKEGDDVVKKTTSYQVNASTGDLTPTVRKDIVSPNGAKSTVIVKQIEPSVRYEKDATRAKGEANVTTAGTLGTSTVTTTYTVNPADGSLIPHEGQPVIKSSTPTVVKVPAKDEVEYLKDGDDVVKKTTTYEVNASTGVLTPTVRKDIASPNGVKSKVVTKIIPVTTRYEADKTKDVGTNTVTNNGSEGKVVTTTSTLVNETNGTVTDGTPIVSRTEMVPKVVKVGAKDKVVETPIEPEVEYVKDVEKDFGTPDERTEGEKGKTVTTTTYDVDPTDGHITEHVGTPVVTPVGKTIVKVGAKTKVEQSKDPEGRDVIDTTTYEVDPKTGKVTPTTVRTYGTSKESTTETRPVPSPVVYEKDDSRDKDSEPVRKEGTPGEETITTTYTVDPKTGAITPTVGKPVRTKEPTNTVVKVGAKDKVVETPIEPEVEYVKDVEKDFGTPVQRTEGEKGKTVTTTTYDVDPKDGHITEHVGNPVVTPAGKTIVKVGAKTKVEQSKDSEGRDVIDTTTYEVDPKTGKVTPTTVRTYGITKEPKVELEQNPKTGDITVTPKKPDGLTYPPGTTVEIPGKGDKSITVTIGEDGKGKVPNSELPEGKVPGTGKITEPGKPAVEVPVENPPKVTIFENGVLPASIELPELMIEVRWIDEDGNVLKSSVKTGSEKDAEHGSIPGYEFVRTVIAENEPVMTHIFRKVSSNTNTIPVTPDTNVNSGHDTPELTTSTPIPVVPVMPDANGNSGYDTPALTTPVPNAVTPNADQVDTKTTNDNGTKSNDSQNVLPNTGTESNATLASLGLLGMLGGLGLAFGKKKED